MLESQIKSYYIKNDNPFRICQGDIIKDLQFGIMDSQQVVNGEIETNIKEIYFPYVIILSQDCDLRSFFIKEVKEDKIFDQYLHNVVFAPAFTISEISDGTHLKELFDINYQPRSIKKEIPKIIQQQDSRFHYLKEFVDAQMPDLIIDFKAYYTLNPKFLFSLYPDNYVATISELFREKLTQRYANYISRIGTPELY